MVKERRKERKEKEKKNITRQRHEQRRYRKTFLSRLDKERGGEEREGCRDGEETACAILSPRESSSGLATPDAGLKKTSYLRLSASAFHLSDFIYSLGYSAINRASRLFKWNV